MGYYALVPEALLASEAYFHSVLVVLPHRWPRVQAMDDKACVNRLLYVYQNLVFKIKEYSRQAVSKASRCDPASVQGTLLHKTVAVQDVIRFCCPPTVSVDRPFLVLGTHIRLLSL